MKQSTLAVLIILFQFFNASIDGYAGDLKIAYVDMEIVFQGYYKTIKADQEIKQQTEIYREYAMNQEKERDVLEQSFNKLRDASQNIALSEDVREQKRTEAQKKFMMLQEQSQVIQDYQKEKRQSLRKQYEEQRNKIVKEIIDVVSDFAEADNYDLIIDHSGNTLNGIPVFVYFRTENDITEKVLTMVNEGHEHELQTPRSPVMPPPAAETPAE